MTNQKTVKPEITVGGLESAIREGCNAVSARIALYQSQSRYHPIFFIDEFEEALLSGMRKPRSPSPSVRRFFKNLRIRSLVNTSTLLVVGSFPSERFEGVRRR